ncbi:uncharacterized protein [Drosophila virilis]|uniref:Uncharacterized protein n=1 Tax=Drosophila virilis TaxID=7244 RepID=B4LVL1_DROVI|nr:uncharacterized protein LOC6627572 [Drosophila virilis]EDW64405.1 uncharacterized protein Dvir_GJ22692 [Drosophila virilis]
MSVGSRHKEWERSLICRPIDNLTTEAGLRAQRCAMVATREREDIPTTMAMLIGWEYARIWLQDRDNYQKKKQTAKKKFIQNDFEWWLKLRKTNKCFCPK